VAAWRAANAGAGESQAAAFAQALLWPGGAVFLVVLVVVWLGWILDID
jgi:hypothetical protein